MAQEPEVRIWEEHVDAAEARRTWEEQERLRLIAEQKPVREVVPQDRLLSAATQEALKMGIDIPKYKTALHEQLTAIRTSDLLAGTTTVVGIHWACYDVLANWIRAEQKALGVSIQRWPWGTWWTIRLMNFDSKTRMQSVTDIAMVMK